MRCVCRLKSVYKSVGPISLTILSVCQLFPLRNILLKSPGIAYWHITEVSVLMEDSSAVGLELDLFFDLIVFLKSRKLG
jgi:hypothetical protein